MTPPVYKVENVTAGYEKCPVLHDLSFALHPGELLGVIGPNGCGKSTLIRVLTRLLPLMGGKVNLLGKDLSGFTQNEFAQSVAVVPQTQTLLFSFTVREVVEMGRYPHSGSLNRMGPEDEAVIKSALTLADVKHLADREVDHLSGGELQRVILARALAQRTRALLLDEPTAHLDLAHQLEVFELLLKLVRSENLATLAIVHDINLAAEFCDRLILISDGRIIANGSPDEVITSANLEKLFHVEASVNPNPQSRRPFMQVRRSPEGRT